MATLNQEATELLTKTKLPSFSIIFETENLTSTEIDNIYRSLASIASQDVLPKQANEFLIIDGDYASPLVIPIILWFELLFIFGRIITYIQPNLLIELYYKSEKKDNEMESSVIV
ncbi:MAG TPA: hypothetical protein V6D25_28735 [Leptolyngbyaceae cyanobacterium]